MDRLANPETSTENGTRGEIKRNEEIWGFVARYFNNYHVSLRPGLTGNQVAPDLKALNDRPRHLYESLGLPCGRTDRIFIVATALTWAGDPAIRIIFRRPGFPKLGAGSV